MILRVPKYVLRTTRTQSHEINVIPSEFLWTTVVAKTKLDKARLEMTICTWPIFVRAKTKIWGGDRERKVLVERILSSSVAWMGGMNEMLNSVIYRKKVESQKAKGWKLPIPWPVDNGIGSSVTNFLDFKLHSLRFDPCGTNVVQRDENGCLFQTYC